VNREGCRMFNSGLCQLSETRSKRWGQRLGGVDGLRLWQVWRGWRREGGGRTHLKITITAEIDSVKGGYAMTFGRYGKDTAVGCAAVGADKGAKRFAPSWRP